MGVYHEGELAVQAHAGVRRMSERVAGSIHDFIPDAAAGFLAERRFIIAGWSDEGGCVWASALWGPPGFARATSDVSVHIEAAPLTAGDPLRAALAGMAKDGDTLPVGLLAIDTATRRRMRLNGRAEARAAAGAGVSLVLYADQVYANCPKYIQQRTPEAAGDAPAFSSAPVRRSDRLDEGQRARVAAADTFYLATAHPEGGAAGAGASADASHRGGNPGFVRVSEDGTTLAWPDYSGNAMFNTLGNITATGRAGLLFLDFDAGDVLQITGRAEVLWGVEAEAAAGVADGEGRAVRFTVGEVIESPGAMPLRSGFVGYSKFNPPAPMAPEPVSVGAAGR